MPRFRVVSFALALAFSGLARAQAPSLPAPAPANQPIPVADFFRDPAYRSLSINGSGTQLATIIGIEGDRSNLITYDIAKKTFQGVGGPDLDIANFDWLNDQQLLFRVVKDRLYAFGLFVGDTTNLNKVRALDRYDVVDVISIVKGERPAPIVWVRHDAENNGKAGRVYKVNPRRRWEDRKSIPFDTVYPDPSVGIPVAYMADQDNQLRYAFVAIDGKRALLRFDGKRWLPTPVDVDNLSVFGAGESDGEIIVGTVGRKDQPGGIHRMDTRTGVLGELLHRDSAYDPDDVSLIRHPKTGRLRGFSLVRKTHDIIWLDPEMQTMAAEIQAAIPANRALIVDGDNDDRKFLVLEFSDRLSGRYYIYDRANKTLQPFGALQPWLDSQRLRETSIITYTARDGAKIEGYLTLPEGADKAHPAPLVVLPHGGPWVRDVWGWDAQAQFLASRGYAVFQPNYRGSPGYSWRFDQADQWAFRKMHEDVTDGVKRLLQSGYIDPQRVAIMGASFGGYLALCGAAFEPDLYRCAITIAGVFDWATVMKESKGSTFRPASYDVLRRHLGDPKQREAYFDEISPLRHVADIKIPIYVAHGREDIVADLGESKALIKKLKQHQVPHEVQLEHGEGHGFGKLANQVELHTRIEAFLAKHLAPTATAPTPGDAGR